MAIAVFDDGEEERRRRAAQDNDGTPAPDPVPAPPVPNTTMPVEPKPTPAPVTSAPAPSALSNVPSAAQHTDANAAGYSPHADLDWGAIEQQLRAAGGSLYDPSDLAGVQRAYYNTGSSGGQGGNVQSAVDAARQSYAQRASNTPNNGQPGVASAAPATASVTAGPSKVGTSPGLNLNASAGGPMFDDPGTMQLESYLRERLNELFQPVADPARDAYASALQARADALGQSNDALDKLLAFANQRFEQLQQPRTDSEQNILNTQRFDPIARDKDLAKQRILETLAARGIDPTSGVAQQALVELEKAYGVSMGQARGQASAEAIQDQQRRASEALDLATFTAEVPETRAREGLDVNSVLAGLSQSVRGETDQRRREALSLVSLLSELPVTRAQQANSLIEGTPTPQSIFQQMLGLAGVNQQQQLINQNQTASLYKGLGTLASIFNK